jgi:hypothetical protein
MVVGRNRLHDPQPRTFRRFHIENDGRRAYPVEALLCLSWTVRHPIVTSSRFRQTVLAIALEDVTHMKRHFLTSAQTDNRERQKYHESHESSNRKITGSIVRRLAPHLICAGASDAIEFYKKAFDATEMVRLAGPDGKLMHGATMINGSMIMLVDENKDYGMLAPSRLAGRP